MPDKNDVEAGIRSIASQLERASSSVDPDRVMQRPRAHEPRRRSFIPLAIVTAAVIGCVLFASQLRGDDDALSTTARPGEPNVIDTITTTPPPATRPSHAAYTGLPFERLPSAGIAVIENERVVLLDFNGLELASAGTPAIEAVSSRPGLAQFAVGPGGQIHPADVGTAAAPPGCDGAQSGGGTRVALCGGEPQLHDQVVLITPTGNTSVLINGAPGSKGAGHWRWAVPSPDGRWVLAQWSGECEAPATFLIRTDGLAVKAVDGHADVGSAAESVGRGWAPDGRVVVELRGGVCGTGVDKPGAYLVNPETAERTLIRPAADGSFGVHLWIRAPGEGGGATTTVASSPPPSQANQLQTRIKAALAELGIAAHPAELSLESAQMTAVFDDGSELFVNAVAAGSDGSDVTVQAERQIAGVVVRTVKYRTGAGARERFDCAGSTYETHGAVPPGFESFDGFLARFIPALRCG